MRVAAKPRHHQRGYTCRNLCRRTLIANLMSFFAELRRRNVFRVAIAYAVTAWLLAQIADVAFDTFGTPEWVGKTVLFLLLLGFPIAVFFAWAFELTPEGIKKEKDVDRSQSITHQTGRKMNYLITTVLAAAVAFLLFDKFLLRDRATPVNAPAELTTAVPDDEPTPPPVASNKATIAVLPFESRSADESDSYFVDGMHDDLLTQLARVGSWKVISRTSVERFRDTTESMQAIGEMLGATSIIEGGVQRAGDRVRINVQLIDAATDEHLWAETYDRELTTGNIFAIQSEIASAIAEALQAKLSPGDVARIGKANTQNLEAYEAYLLGRERWRQRTAESLAEAERLFRRAIDLDPDYALAYVGLADVHRFQVIFSGYARDDGFPRAERAIARALELDDQLGEAWASLGSLKLQKNELEGLPALKRAIELNPNYSPAYVWYGIGLHDTGRPTEAAKIFAQGLELDPLSVPLRANAAFVAATLGHLEEAHEAIEQIIAIDRDSPLGYYVMASFQAGYLGHYDNALPWATRAIRTDPGNPAYAVLLAQSYMHLGDSKTAERWLAKATDIQPDSDDIAFANLLLAIYRNDGEGALSQARLMLDRQPDSDGSDLAMAQLRDHDLAENRPERARQRYRERYPEIFGPGGPVISYANSSPAEDIAYLLLQSGEKPQAKEMLEQIFKINASLPLLGGNGTFFGNAKVYALMGRKPEALAELRRGIDANWRTFWRYFFDHDAVFESLRDNPEFQAMRAEVAADMAAQLARVREMEASGEIPAPEDL